MTANKKTSERLLLIWTFPEHLRGFNTRKIGIEKENDSCFLVRIVCVPSVRLSVQTCSLRLHNAKGLAATADVYCPLFYLFIRANVGELFNGKPIFHYTVCSLQF